MTANPINLPPSTPCSVYAENDPYRALHTMLRSSLSITTTTHNNGK
jgi:hypothetical protein